MTQGLVARPLTREAGFQYLASLCGIYSGESDTGTGFSRKTSVSTYYLLFHQCSVPIILSSISDAI